MRKRITQDEIGTHVSWELNGVTSDMINWFMSNMEKGFYLWHPNQHLAFGWFIDLTNGPLDSIHWALERWDNGVTVKPYIRMERLENVPEKVLSVIKYDHVMIAGGMDLDGKTETYDPQNPQILSYRVHQWEKSDCGTIGCSSAIELVRNDVDSGLTWAAHGSQEIGNWEAFLPQLYRLYSVIDTPSICPHFDFSVAGKGIDAKYTKL